MVRASDYEKVIHGPAVCEDCLCAVTGVHAGSRNVNGEQVHVDLTWDEYFYDLEDYCGLFNYLSEHQDKYPITRPIAVCGRDYSRL